MLPRDQFVSIQELLKSLFPIGTRGTPSDINLAPLWPLDIFGAAAYVVKKSDSQTSLINHHVKLRNSARLNMALGGFLRKEPNDPEVLKVVQNYWSKMISGSLPDSVSDEDWLTATLNLIAITDEAAKGVGFANLKSTTNPPSWISSIFALRSVFTDSSWLQGSELRIPASLTHPIKTGSPTYGSVSNPSESGCFMIPKSQLCVLPKARTPSVGCTLRSLTHNLSLHTGIGEMESVWCDIDHTKIDRQNECNILIVPYPYNLPKECFREINNSALNYKLFSYSPSVAASKNNDITRTVVSLIEKAEKVSGHVDIIILPELSLSPKEYNKLHATISSTGLKSDRILIAGVEEKVGTKQFNTSITTFYRNGKTELEVHQQKHHRWKLDPEQIESYQLKKQFEIKNANDDSWWEDTVIERRRVYYTVFKPGVCLATLICEDLARTDPCIDSLQAVGPNIVVALLMDGPQLQSRWPGRNALGLSDDPGSSVLTVTSLGMVRRSNRAFRKKNPGTAPKDVIALWRDSRHPPEEITIAKRAKGVLLNLRRHSYSEQTLDGREDGGKAHSWQISGKPLQLLI